MLYIVETIKRLSLLVSLVGILDDLLVKTATLIGLKALVFILQTLSLV